MKRQYPRDGDNHLIRAVLYWRKKNGRADALFTSEFGGDSDMPNPYVGWMFQFDQFICELDRVVNRALYRIHLHWYIPNSLKPVVEELEVENAQVCLRRIKRQQVDPSHWIFEEFPNKEAPEYKEMLDHIRNNL